MNKKTYEILPEGQVLIIEEVVKCEERIVDVVAVEKRITEIKSQMASLGEELADWEALIDAVKKGKEDAKVPDNDKKVK